MTFVEVLAVVVILGMIAGTLAVGFSAAFGKGKRELAKTGIGQLVGKVEAYYIARGSWPDPSAGLSALTDGAAAPTEPYYVGRDQLLDPWGNTYYLVVPGPEGHPYEIVSYGADGQPGGDGESADVSSLNLRDRQP